jgi:arabinan endo-1,5-alpha-L-arabinosidase
MNRLILIISVIISGLLNSVYAFDLKGSTFSHDPATLIKDGDTYWHFFTAPGVGAAYSKDMITWTSSKNRIFQTGSNWKNNYPAWTIPYFGSGESANTDGNLWAPDVIFMNGAYYLYYSCSSFGSTTSAIGCVRSKSLNNPKWEDMGKVVSSVSRSDFNAIDPGMFRDDDGKVYMVYGSFSAGIGIVDIDTITGLATSTVKYLAGESGRSYEAPALFKEEGYYYLVINRGSCCNGVNSTYYMIVGRSKSVKGPYSDFRTLLPNKDGKYIGPGHFSLYRDNCAKYVTAHYYDGTANGFARYDILRMKMVDGWPVLTRTFSMKDCDENPTGTNTLNFGSEGVNNADFSLFPVPAINKLNLIIPESLAKDAEITIYNVVGQAVYSKNNIEKTETIDIHFLKSGFYNIVVSNQQVTVSKKFVK